MGATGISKFWFFVKIFFIILFLVLFFFVVMEKDLIVEEFCDCVPCEQRDVTRRNSPWDDFVDAYCLCPKCD